MNWTRAAFQKTIEYACAGILLVAAVAKLASLRSEKPILQTLNPFIPVANEQLYLGLALIELFVAHRIIFSPSSFTRSALLVWLAFCFSIYRLGFLLGNIKEPCPCLGTGYEWWPWMARNLSSVSIAVFCVFVALVTAHAFSTFHGNATPSNGIRDSKDTAERFPG